MDIGKNDRLGESKAKSLTQGKGCRHKERRGHTEEILASRTEGLSRWLSFLPKATKQLVVPVADVTKIGGLEKSKGIEIARGRI